MRKIGLLAVMVFVCLGTVYTADKIVVGDEIYEIKLTSNDNPSTIWMQNMQNAADSIREITDGHVDIQIYGNGEMLIGDAGREAVLSDAAVFLFGDPGDYSAFVPEWGTLCAPYLWNDWTEVEAFEKTPMMKKMLDLGKEKNLHVVGDSFLIVGVRSVMANAPVKTLADLRKLVLRVPGSPNYTGMASALGMNYQAMAMSETYNALETGMIDGCENTTCNFANNGIADSIKTPYYSLTNHIVCMVAVCCGQGYWDSLPKEYQKVITDQFASLIANSNKEVANAETELRARLESQRVKIVEIPDLTEFKAAVESYNKAMPMYDELAAVIASLRK